MCRCLPSISALVALIAAVSLGACRTRPPTAPKPASVFVEVFAVNLAADGRTIGYVCRSAPLADGSRNPDSLARDLIAAVATPVVLHSTSWRWEKEGVVILTYLAYCGEQPFRGAEPVNLPTNQLTAPASTDPQHPRPAEIRPQDVLTHGLRHVSFLLRYSRDTRLAAALSPQSRAFFTSLCGQLAGRLDDARAFQECVVP